MKYGENGIEYYLKFFDKDAPNSGGQILTVIAKGFSCLHPYIVDELFTSYYSERGLSNELYGTYVDEAKNILLNNIQFRHE